MMSLVGGAGQPEAHRLLGVDPDGDGVGGRCAVEADVEVHRSSVPELFGLGEVGTGVVERGHAPSVRCRSPDGGQEPAIGGGNGVAAKVAGDVSVAVEEIDYLGDRVVEDRARDTGPRGDVVVEPIGPGLVVGVDVVGSDVEHVDVARGRRYATGDVAGQPRPGGVGSQPARWSSTASMGRKRTAARCPRFSQWSLAGGSGFTRHDPGLDERASARCTAAGLIPRVSVASGQCGDTAPAERLVGPCVVSS